MKLKDEQGMTKKDIPTSFFEMLNIRLPKGKFWQKSIYKLAVNKIRMEMQKELLTESPERCFYKKKFSDGACHAYDSNTRDSTIKKSYCCSCLLSLLNHQIILSNSVIVTISPHHLPFYLYSRYSCTVIT